MDSIGSWLKSLQETRRECHKLTTTSETPLFELNTLRTKLQPHLGWHGVRVLFVAAFLIALRAKTVNLSELAAVFPGLAKPESQYKRQQRFFRAFEMDYAVIAELVVAWMAIPEPWVLAVDRMQWDVGTTPVNILRLGVVHEGIAFRLVWVMLDKKGNSNTDEGIDLMEQFYEQLFDGHRRLKRRRLWGRWVYVSATRMNNNKLLVVATDRAPETAIADYALRWSIETFQR